MPLKSIIHATLALAAAGALCGPAVAQNLPTAPSRTGEEFVVGDRSEEHTSELQSPI